MAEGLKRASQAAARTRWDGKLTEAQRSILAVLRAEPGEGWLTNAHIAKACGQGDNRSWASGKVPRLSELGLVEISGDRLWRRITEAGRLAIKDA